MQFKSILKLPLSQMEKNHLPTENSFGSTVITTCPASKHAIRCDIYYLRYFSRQSIDGRMCIFDFTGHVLCRWKIHNISPRFRAVRYFQILILDAGLVCVVLPPLIFIFDFVVGVKSTKS